VLLLCAMHAPSSGQTPPIALKRVSPEWSGTGIWACFPPGRDDLMFEAYRFGEIRAVSLPAYSFTFGDRFRLPSVCWEGEGGLLGLACHPQFELNGHIYA